ncbi:MAG: AIR synthase related protein [bacterium]
MDKVELIHGAGGSATDKLIKEVFLAALGNEYLNDLEDAALILWPQGELAFSTDSFTVQPLFFPGGDIGRLAAAGTVNDLLMRGARPLYLSAAFIIEEGFPVKKLTTVVRSLAVTCRQAGVKVIAGDTKVVNRGSGDGLFITTSGLGLPAPNINISIKNARAGDKIIVSGSVG